jgi:hypothetical protein
MTDIKKELIPKLLDNDNPNVPPEDKQKIRGLLKNPGTCILEGIVLYLRNPQY